ncbi:hypothetical protein AB0D86_49805 [Streptomyces sp. NPDC048324]|uniref:hypothetical protein n=1 Tax=Streptomyces sp. NPDC048324 TaxID=3157205 RepID=UPI003418FA94
MDVLVLIGRILLAALFLGSAVGHLTRTKVMAGYASSRGVPVAVPATFGSGLLLLLLGSLSVLPRCLGRPGGCCWSCSWCRPCC